MKDSVLETLVRQRYVIQVEFRPLPTSPLVGTGAVGLFPLAPMGSSLPTEHANLPFERPGSGFWARTTIYNLPVQLLSIGPAGGRRFRSSNILIVQLFGEVDVGQNEQKELAEFIASIFDSLVADGVHYRAADVQTIGRDKNWWQINVTCPFYADDIH